MAERLDFLLDNLKQKIASYGDQVIVAFSGGVDSTVVGKVATLALGREKVRCIVAKSESNTEDDIAICRAIAAEHDLNLEVIEYSELAIPNYAENPSNRCYFCKSELYTRLSVEAIGAGSVVLDGSNADDVGDYRPGLKAVEENAVRSPLRECGIGKADVRALAQMLGLPNHDRPSAPCLSSRIPYGDPITKQKLDQVAAVEKFLRGLGFRELRCRHHGDVARLEVPESDFSAILAHREAILAECKRVGFTWTSLDIAGFKSGSLNQILTNGNNNNRT